MNIQDFQWISFRTDWFYLLAVQGALKSLLQHHSSKASILRRSAFFTVLHYLPDFDQLTSIELVMPSSYFILFCPLLILPSIFPSIRVFFQWIGSSHMVAKVWSSSFSISPSNEYSRLISFRIDWFDHLAVQGTLKSLLQHHSSKASILLCSFLYSPTLTSIHNYWKNHSLEETNLCLCFLIHCLGQS